MEAKYNPPFDLTEKITSLTVDICLLVRQVQDSAGLSRSPRLRKANRVRSIHSSLAIEHNSMTLEQVTAVIAGKRVLAPPREIREVLNAYEAYDRLQKVDACEVKDLLDIHGIMMKGLAEDAGSFRSGTVGVFKGDRLLHVGAPAENVHYLMKDLMDWLRLSKVHPLIKSCIFHYEFEFIHPFSDGNGRTGRFWHTLILSKWEPLFAWLPIESLVNDHQEEYFRAITEADSQGKSTVFIEFMLEMIKGTLEENVGINVGINEQRLLSFLSENPQASAATAAISLGLSSRQVERLISKLKDEGRLVREGSRKAGEWHVVNDCH